MSRRRRDAEPRFGVHVGLEQRLLSRLKGLPRLHGGLVVVGFSGGADSLALAASLGRVAHLAQTTVELLHVDHGLRASSHEDAQQAREMARRLGLPCRIRRVDDDRLRQHVGVGPEEAARRERYRIFAEEALARDASAVALAHHQSDQAETVLLHLLRGSGLHGVSGMRPMSVLSIPWWAESEPVLPAQLHFWRPFLAERRDDVRSYAAGIGLDPTEDASNLDTTFRRNAVRHEVVPILERLFPEATAALARFADVAAQGDEFLMDLANQVIEASRDDAGRLRIESVAQQHIAIQRAVIHAWLADHGIEPGVDRVDAVLDLVAHPRRGRLIEVGNGLHVSVSDGWIVCAASPIGL